MKAFVIPKIELEPQPVCVDAIAIYRPLVRIQHHGSNHHYGGTGAEAVMNCIRCGNIIGLDGITGKWNCGQCAWSITDAILKVINPKPNTTPHETAEFSVGDWVCIGFGARKWRVISSNDGGWCELQEMTDSKIVVAHKSILCRADITQGEAWSQVSS